MHAICMFYLPQIGRSYHRDSLKTITNLLDYVVWSGFSGIYLIALFKSGGADNGFDITEYSVDPAYGTEEDFTRLIQRAHELGLTIGVDLVPNHVSNQHPLILNCLNGVEGFEDVMYIVTADEAKRLTEAGVPSFFGHEAYSDYGNGIFARNEFADGRMPKLNWESETVQNYFRQVIRDLRHRGVDFLRVDCGPLLLEDVSKADPNNPLATLRPRESVEAVRAVAEGMELFFEWFDPSSAGLFDQYLDSWALDCSYVFTGQPNLDWRNPNLIPLLGGHDQMTAADRGLDIDEALAAMTDSAYGFLDFQTLLEWTTDPNILPGDEGYDADLSNPNQRFRGRRPYKPIVEALLATSGTL